MRTAVGCFGLALAAILCFGGAVAEAADDIAAARQILARAEADFSNARTPTDCIGVVRQIEEARAKAPNWPEVHYFLGVVEKTSQHYGAAIAAFETFLSLAPKSPDAPKVRQMIAEMRADAGLPPTANMSPADTLLAQGRYREAIAAYEQMLAAKPNSAPILYQIGLCHSFLNDLRNAVAYYERAIAADSAYRPAYNNLGNSYREIGRLEDAERTYRRGLDIAPSNANLQRNLGILYLDTQRPRQAYDALTRADALDPGNVKTYRQIGVAAARMGRAMVRQGGGEKPAQRRIPDASRRGAAPDGTRRRGPATLPAGGQPGQRRYRGADQPERLL